MSTPEDALERARREAEGAYEDEPALERTSFDADVEEGITPELLREWAVIQVDPAGLYSTRRFGAPLTFAKRSLLRLLRQYTAELEAQQTRFNLALLARLRELERRSGE